MEEQKYLAAAAEKALIFEQNKNNKFVDYKLFKIKIYLGTIQVDNRKKIPKFLKNQNFQKRIF